MKRLFNMHDLKKSDVTWCILKHLCIIMKLKSDNLDSSIKHTVQHYQ